MSPLEITIRFRSLVLIAPFVTFCSGPALGVDFDRDVMPLLREHCIDCHGGDAAEANLRLESIVDALRGGDSGEPVIVPGQSDQSHLIERLTSDDVDHRMPPESDPLSPAQISVFREWIDDAAIWKAAQAELASRKSDHWSFQPLVRPALPVAANQEIGASHPIDVFVQDRLHQSGLKMSTTASRRRLIRRLYLVMHGLPPTPREVERFIHDQRGDAWERLVDEVLESPRYGERWATYWLDLVRFGETHGFETNQERPNAWPYRDWVISALNEDKPYDQFIFEQIAGDAVGADVATSFLVAGPYDVVKSQDPELTRMQRQDELADIINTTGTAFLGLTLGCARCHNHKFDPVTQTDYYALQAVFAGVTHAERSLPLDTGTQSRIDKLDDEIATLQRRLAKFIATQRVDQALRPAVEASANTETFPAVTAKFVRFTINATNGAEPCIDELEVFSDDVNIALASSGGKVASGGDFVHPLHKLDHINDGRYGNPRSWIAKQREGGWVQIQWPEPMSIDRIVWGRDREGRYGDRLAIDYKIEISVDGSQWTVVASSDDRRPYKSDAFPEPQYNFESFGEVEAKSGRDQLLRLNSAIAERESIARPAMAYAGTFTQPGPIHRLYRGEPGSPREQVSPSAIASLSDVNLDADSPEQQRRVAIAKWIASETNPLTARVMVNRLWQFHFGTGIVDTPSDFGGNGTLPSHPELLDYLATEFLDRGWSIKQMHRLILTSETWKQDSAPRANALATDAATRLLWRFPPRRLEAEGIRDCMLAVSGALNLGGGGPGFSVFEIEKENVRHYFPKKDFGPDGWRRMIYMTRVRQERDAVFGVFDCPDFNQVVPERSRSTTPLQALNLLNSRFVMQQAAMLVERLDREADSPREKISLAYQLCFGRDANNAEIDAALRFVQATNWKQFARAILNANEFVFVP